MKAWTLAVFVAVTFCCGAVAVAREETAASVSPKEARAILLRMAEFMARTGSFSVSVRDSYDVHQKSGQKIEFSEKRKITVARPDRLRIDVEESNGERQMLLYDGKELTVATPSRNVYARTPQPGTIDDAINYILSDLGMKVPFSVLLQSTAAKELDRKTQSIGYVEKTSIFGAPAHHLAGRTASVDYQIWIADGDQPLPQRLVLTYRKEKGQPQFRAQFSDWNLAAELPAALFQFVPPEGMHKIAFLPQLPQAPGRKNLKPVKAGTVKEAGRSKMKARAARELKQVFIPLIVISMLTVLVGSVAVAHARGGARWRWRWRRVYPQRRRSDRQLYGWCCCRQSQIDHPGCRAARIADNRRDIVDTGHRDHPVAAAAVAARAVDNRQDYYGGSGGAYYVELPCSSSETYIDGVMYYACGTTYYVESYSGGSVVYVLSPPPPGY